MKISAFVLISLCICACTSRPVIGQELRQVASASLAADILPADYRQKTFTVENPLVLNYEFGPAWEDRISLNVINYPNQKSDLFFFHMHMNETTSKKTGEEGVRQNGGTFMYMVHQGSIGQRDMTIRLDSVTYEMDPNRIFTGRALLEKTSPRPTPAHLARLQNFVNWLKRNILAGLDQRHRRMVIALHNNTDDNVEGPLLSILTEKKLMGLDNRAVNVNLKWDIDNFFIATQKSTYDALIANGNPNISLRLEKPRDIGYLSNWMINDNIEYLNVETQHGDQAGNRQMFALIQNVFH